MNTIHLDTKTALPRLGLVCGMLLLAGCSRTFYREQANADANFLIDQKANAACAPADEFRIAIDPQSRMYDPYDPDLEPQPPDDPKSHTYMLCVDCKKGSKCWRCLPQTCFVDNPTWQAYLPRDAMGDVVLDMDGALDLALINSPDYQENLEELFLSALDVSFERFRFDAQFFGGSSVFYTADGKDRAGGDSSSVLNVSPSNPANRLRVNRLTATGGEIVAGVANSLIWQFAGPNDYTSTTLFDFAIIQPLLRGGGRTRILERLTIAERTLLANIRAMERYRRGFYLQIVTGADPGQGPSRRGGFFGGAGLEGFSGIGGGGFGGVGNFGGGGFFGGQGQGGGFTGGAGAQGAGGYMGLLQSMQQIRNQRANVAALRESVEQLQASYDAGRIDRFQVDLTQQALYNAQSQLLTSETIYQASLDNFKIQLGLTPELDVKIEDPLLDEFNLLDPDLEALQERVTEVLGELREIREALAVDDGATPPAEPAPPIENEDVGRLLAGDANARLERILQSVRGLQETVATRIAAVDRDFAALEAALPRRRELLVKLAERPEVQDAEIDRALFDPNTVDVRVAQRRAELATLKQQLANVWRPLEQLEATNNFGDRQLVNALIDTAASLSSHLLELTLVQAAVRLEAIAFDPVELAPAEALVIASAYRRDWQNARAQLVDTWRLIYFNANDLLSDLDIVFSGDIGNLGDNPLRVRDTTGRLRVGVEFDAPLTRLAERNVYRQSLIEYQQARRSYYQFRDRVYQGLRNTLRQIGLNEINFELRRAAVLVAIAQVDNTQLRLYEPPQPGVEAQFSNTTARDLVQSLSDLLNVQNDFLSVWVNYEVQRLNLDYDLGVMLLDDQGRRVEQDVPLRTWYDQAVQQGAAICRPSDLVPGTGLLNTLPPIEGASEEAVTVPLPNVEVDDPSLLPAPPTNGRTSELSPAEIDAVLGGDRPVLGPDGGAQSDVTPEGDEAPEQGSRLRLLPSQ